MFSLLISDGHSLHLGFIAVKRQTLSTETHTKENISLRLAIVLEFYSIIAVA